MYFQEDLSRTSKDNALENLSLVRKIVYNVVKLDTRYDRINKNGNLVKLSLKRKINRYNLYPNEFEDLFFLLFLFIIIDGNIWQIISPPYIKQIKHCK